MTVGALFKEHKRRLRLELVAGRSALGRRIVTPEVNRPGLALAGFPANFRAERVQIIGRGEQAYCLEAPAARLSANLERMLENPALPCLVVTRGLRIPAALAEACRRRKVPLLRTRLDTAAFVGELTFLLEEKLAPLARLHGVLVDVYGLGVLIQGEAGIGKSECALELVKRGHILVADDIVEVRQKHGDVLVGSCPDALRHYLEVRGLGIIDVKLLFGVGSILNHSTIGLAVNLEAWNPEAHYDRTGLHKQTSRILDVDVPLVRIPVTPGRNLAVLIEVAALNQRLRQGGTSSAEDFNKRLLARMSGRRP
ncbi:MAG: HPr(Ser) kinase/phosphatase [Elusimicrobia bacterium]|nr:HPr(Ser) kinase/phosphatase [Elusimicrobiota bacterium]